MRKLEVRIDCNYIDIEQQKLRPYCERLEREIRARDCNDCGWYYLNPDRALGLGTVTREDVLRILKAKDGKKYKT